MSLFKRFNNGPTPEQKARAEGFKNTLKYGSDIGSMYKDVHKRLGELSREAAEVNKICEKAIMKQQNIVLKDTTGNWNSIFIRSWTECEPSPLGVCVTMNEFGFSNPDKNNPQNCFYCNKVFK